jgi:hypothetical protein
MQYDPIWAYNQMAKKTRPHCRKKPKIDLWEITGCTIQEIERPEIERLNVLTVRNIAPGNS